MSANGHILVVDDETHIVHVVSLKLRNAGYEVKTAGDGEEAFELACQDPPVLIITDLQMPYMTGLELCTKLREREETADIPALLLTARGYALEDSDMAKTNIKQMINKPFSPRQILEQVHALIGDPSGMESEAA